MSKSPEVDAYIAQFPLHTQKQLNELRHFILKTVPEATEFISYRMPAYKINSVLVYFAGYGNHIGFYPTSAGISAFQKEITAYKNSKGAIQFELGKKLPLNLVKKMLLFRKHQDAEKIRKKPPFRICPNGHRYVKNSNCPTCPVCEKQNNTKAGVFFSLSAPAIRALHRADIQSLKQLSKFTLTQILALHGIGKSSVPTLKKLLAEEGLNFKTEGQKNN